MQIKRTAISAERESLFHYQNLLSIAGCDSGSKPDAGYAPVGGCNTTEWFPTGATVRRQREPFLV